MKKHVYLCIAALLLFSCSNTSRAVKYPNMLADVDPYSIGTANAYLDYNIFSMMASSKAREEGLRSISIEVILYPRENEVALEFNNGQSLYIQLWNEAGRKLFTEALDKYKEDLANQKLIPNYNKARSIYGKTKGRFQWKTLSFSPTYRSSPVFSMGHYIKENAPYYSIYQNNAKEETGANQREITESPRYSIYFTKTQAEELAALFKKVTDTFPKQ
jgi:hypothetical protein